MHNNCYIFSEQGMSFLMPNQSAPGLVDIVLTLSPDVQAKYKFEYLADPLVESVERAITVAR